MKSTQIHHVFEALTPSAEQKENMWNSICVQKNSTKRTGKIQLHIRRKLLIPIVACIVMFTVSVTSYAATDGKIVAMIKDQVHQIFFANGDTVELQIFDNGNTNLGISGVEGDWLVKKSGARLLLKINGEKINIAEALSKNGYFYYDYRDGGDILHRLYIVKNAGGTKDYSERWYSQFEWLPEYGISGGSRGISGPLATAIMSAESEATDGKDSLDTLLQKYLAKYWNEYS
ncbi:hypothetical protein [Paenibacillus segetis]|uniref:Uncharacterized protein n=1 Tax=Paenibacillus segetis TaxID=1325360 RepID=A0ABQ1YBP6_9BACL|nr:hypothetical protein [Paenibacillus segetis]GGH19410.1 hypothetical protein GCM10008013_16070 [Paenibacillus segetis]